MRFLAPSEEGFRETMKSTRLSLLWRKDWERLAPFFDYALR